MLGPHVPGGVPVSAPEGEELQPLAVGSGVLVPARLVCQLRGFGAAVLVAGNVWGWKSEEGFTSQRQHGTLIEEGQGVWHLLLGGCCARRIMCVHVGVCACVCISCAGELCAK